jgi:tetratricopeptide (TPR) repeat protein
MISIKFAQSLRLPTGLALLIATLMLRQIIGAEPVGQDKFALRAAVEYQLAQAQFQAATNDSPTAWQFARACYNLAEFATNDENRASLAIQGIGACRQLLKEQPKSGAGHYWLGMNLGELARTELLGALALVREMEGEFKIAWSLDTTVDHAGAARSLGLLYREAPGWPASIGSKRKAKEWLERAALTAPDFPENWLVLTESYLEWDEPDTARQKLEQLVNNWPAAQTNLTGVAWEADWADWNARRAAAQARLAEQSAPVKSSRRSE